ncbi:hypothetical protein [Frankia sp. Cppng1_Ct_nod]|nr:hypothetical protein [Frankia sp. Cppng1_Ct_nod]
MLFLLAATAAVASCGSAVVAQSGEDAAANPTASASDQAPVGW